MTTCQLHCHKEVLVLLLDFCSILIEYIEILHNLQSKHFQNQLLLESTYLSYIVFIWYNVEMNLLFEENVFWFKITMNQFRFFDNFQCINNLLNKESRQIEWKPIVVILPQEIINWNRQQLKDNAEMISENKKVKHSD
jgi:hypothetical protein